MAAARLSSPVVASSIVAEASSDTRASCPLQAARTSDPVRTGAYAATSRMAPASSSSGDDELPRAPSPGSCRRRPLPARHRRDDGLGRTRRKALDHDDQLPRRDLLVIETEHG